MFGSTPRGGDDSLCCRHAHTGRERRRSPSNFHCKPRRFNQIVRMIVVGGDRLLALSYDSIIELELVSLDEVNHIRL